MKAFLLAILLITGSIPTILAQQDTIALLNEAKTKLQAGTASISYVLSYKRYLVLHPETTFREIIKEHATADVLTITTDNEPGKKIIITGIVKNKKGQPVTNALVYLYQTDSKGWYAADAPHILMNEGDMRHARLFGYVRTDKNGKFELHTVKPSGYPQSDLPAHIHVHIMAEGYRSYLTEFLFQDDERLKGEILNRAIIDGGIISKPGPAEAPFAQKFSYTITLRQE
jgi:protocatechuate 3,4-dioxygenase beta subunit